MAVTAYVLIQTEVGKAAQVAEEVAKIDGVVSAEDVTGPYDVIVRAEAGSVDELGKMVVSKVQLIDGITRTLTCPVVHLSSLSSPDPRVTPSGRVRRRVRIVRVSRMSRVLRRHEGPFAFALDQRPVLGGLEPVVMRTQQVEAQEEGLLGAGPVVAVVSLQSRPLPAALDCTGR